MKLTKLLSLCVLASFGVLFNGCGAGGTNSSLSASVTSGSCTNMSTGSTCTITLNVFNNDNGAVLGYSPSLFGSGFDQNQSFSNSVADCNAQVAGNANSSPGTCLITIIYQTTGHANTANLTFYLCNPGQVCNANNSVTTSNVTPLSGN